MTYVQSFLKKESLRHTPLKPDLQGYLDVSKNDLTPAAMHYNAHNYRQIDEKWYDDFLERAAGLPDNEEIKQESLRLWDLGVKWGYFPIESAEDIANGKAVALAMAKARHLLRVERPILEFALMQEELEESSDAIDLENSILKNLYLTCSDESVEINYHPFPLLKPDHVLAEEIFEQLGAAQLKIGGESLHGRIYTRGSDLVLIANDSISPLTVDALAAEIAKLKITDHGSVLEKPLPRRIVGDILRKQSFPGFRNLRSVVRHPFFDSKGRIYRSIGYNKEYQVYISNSRTFKLKDPEEAASHLMDEVLFMGDDQVLGWPFVSEADQANALAMAMTPFLRPTIETAPAFLLMRQSAAGTGTTLLATSLMKIAFGQDVERFIGTMPDDEGELEKTLFSYARDGSPLILFDNVRRKLNSKALESFMTSKDKTQRAFFTQSISGYPNVATVVITGNKGDITANTDMKRRVCPITLDARVEEPWLRAGNFRHDAAKGDAIDKWVLDHQTELIRDILSMASGWNEAGNPEMYRGPNLGKFEEWSYVIGNILGFVGIKNFLGNLSAFYQDADPDRYALTEMFILLAEEIGEGKSKTMVAREIYDLLKGARDNTALPINVLKALDSDNANALGKVLQGLAYGEIANGMKLIREKDQSKNAFAYRIVKA